MNMSDIEFLHFCENRALAAKENKEDLKMVGSFITRLYKLNETQPPEAIKGHEKDKIKVDPDAIIQLAETGFKVKFANEQKHIGKTHVFKIQK